MLEFIIGTLTYTKPAESVQTAQSVNTTIGAALGSVTLALLLTIVVVVTMALLLLYLHKRTKIQQHNS